MFVNQKELVEKLVLDLQERFGTQYICCYTLDRKRLLFFQPKSGFCKKGKYK